MFFSYPLMIIIGGLAGAIKGLTSASGVMIVVPLLNMIFRFSVHSSIGTSLMVDFLSSLAISYIFYKYRNLDIKSGIWIALGSIIGAQIGVLFAVQVPERPLGYSFALFMFLTGALLWKKGVDREKIVRKFQNVMKFYNLKERIVTAIFLGFLVGLASGIFGAGGGIMILLILVFILNFSLQKAIGTSIFIMALTSFSGMAGYAYHHNVNILGGFFVSLGAILAGVLGALLVNRISEKKLNKVVGVIFSFLGLAMAIFLSWPSCL